MPFGALWSCARSRTISGGMGGLGGRTLRSPWPILVAFDDSTVGGTSSPEFVSINTGSGLETNVGLFNGFHLKIGNPDPGRRDLDRLPHRESQTADDEGVRERSGGDVDVEHPCSSGDGAPSRSQFPSPSASRIRRGQQPSPTPRRRGGITLGPCVRLWIPCPGSQTQTPTHCRLDFCRHRAGGRSRSDRSRANIGIDKDC